MSDVIYQSSDLVNRRVEVLEAARTGRARVRDKDGTSLVMLRESQLQLLEGLVEWGSAGIRLEELLARVEPPTIADFGDLAWLRVFDQEEKREFLDELHESLQVARADRDLSPLNVCVTSWRTTARQLEDPLRRAVLRGSLTPDDLAEVERPSAG